jgi:sulfatase maturation enzyme AslB (radical SAM superfamily)
MLQNRLISEIPKYRKCKFALLCGGGCVAKAYEETGSICEHGCEDDIEKLVMERLPTIYDRLIKENRKDRNYINKFFLE